MRVAVVGTGVAGLVTARLLLRAGHDVTVFEAGAQAGGHVRTVEVELEGRRVAVDTGFIVHNDRTYPGFVRLLEELGVPRQDSDMSFSVSDAASGLEYNGTSFDALFAQRVNLLRPSFWGLVRDILRFFREGRALVAATGGLDPWAGRLEAAALPAGRAAPPPDPGPSLGAFLAQGHYGRAFIEHFLLPMGAAIWSAPPQRLADYPAAWFLRFFENHGMLEVANRPMWKTIPGGSRRYVEALTAGWGPRLRLRTPVARLERHAQGLELVTAGGERARFERAVLACHAPQALALLAQPTPAEREVLGALRTQANEAALHTDAAVLPRARRAWAAWNVHRPRGGEGPVAVTYWMNRLQALPVRTPLLVSLNRERDVDPQRVLDRVTFRHPEFSAAAVRAQARWAEIDGADRVHFAGAFWGWGFHEDGVRSAQCVARRFGIAWPGGPAAAAPTAPALAGAAR